MRHSLVAIDTNHIKSFVFGTSKLKEIRGASAILDKINRKDMRDKAKCLNIESIYTNGGSGLFIGESDQVESFVNEIQKAFQKKAQGGASISFAIQPLLDKTEKEIINADGKYNMHCDVSQELELLRYKLQDEQTKTPETITNPSHPFFQPCDSCGVNYAEHEDTDPNSPNTYQYYCTICKAKQEEDATVKRLIKSDLSKLNCHREEEISQNTLWGRMLTSLQTEEYTFPPSTDDSDPRPSDFNVFENFAEGKKGYLGIIYADANNMGNNIEQMHTLAEVKKFAEIVDNSVHRAVSQAIKEHLPVKNGQFPFDILILGGDDIVLVTDAPQALPVSLTIARQFKQITEEEIRKLKADKNSYPNLAGQDFYTLSIGAALVPIKYPFNISQRLAESTLKFAKMVGADKSADASNNMPDSTQKRDDTHINFMVVTGGSDKDFKNIYHNLYHRKDKKTQKEFFATLRPYTADELAYLLEQIRIGNSLNIGRTKLHQLREAILEMNLSTSVTASLAVLRNWNIKTRDHMTKQVYEFQGRTKLPPNDPTNPFGGFPRVTFPWFIENGAEAGQEIYRTSLLDFVELYDFVAGKDYPDTNDTK